MGKFSNNRFSARSVAGPLPIVLLALACLISQPSAALAELVPLQVAYAGSMGSLMDGGVKPAVAKAINADLQGRAQGSTGFANLIVAGSIRPDVFIAVTPGPMGLVLKAGKSQKALPIARTEMVIAYSPKSQYASQLAKANDPGAKPWWQILETQGLRFGRTDPNTDPQGVNIIFTMQLAGDYYHQPGLAAKILGPVINPQQIFQEAQVMGRLQAGQLDASSAYKTQPAALGVPFLELPKEINLGDASLENEYRKTTVTLNGKTLHPSPLIFYAAVLKDAPQPALANRFLTWLQGPEAKAVFSRYHYDDTTSEQALTP
ncbi:MAG: substrate-binding domain-containing protein [Acidobacteriaceae bacterium]|nr:substrate-binding domain-containing protein [Acidobacteriaceae bacterium]